MAHAPLKPVSKQRGAVADLAIGAAWLVGLAAALTILDGVLASVPIAAATLTSLLVAVAVGRAGVIWDQDDPESKAVARPLAVAGDGFLRAAAAMAVALGVSRALGWVSLSGGQLNVSVVLSVFVAATGAVREELLYRALPLHFAGRARLDLRAVSVFTALLSTTPLLLGRTANPAAVALAFSLGLFNARLLLRTRSVFPAIASNWAFHLIAGPALESGVTEITWSTGSIGLGNLASGSPAWIASALFLLAAAFGMPKASPSQRTDRPRPREGS